jgi:large subunit ribosomal protein L3
VSETHDAQNTEAAVGGVKLSGLFAFKDGMTTLYTEQGEAIPVTILRYEPWVVSQRKTKESDGYDAVQIACRPRKAKNALSSERGHLKAAGFENGAQMVREIRQALSEDVVVGAQVAISSMSVGDSVKITSTSKGKGFAGSVKRWGFAGGPASHGSKFHRRPGSSGNRTWPGRVMPGKKFPGHMGDDTVSVKNVQVVSVLPEEGVVIVKGPVPGARNSLVRLMKEA